MSNEEYNHYNQFLWKDPDEIKDDWGYGRIVTPLAVKVGLHPAIVYDYVFRKCKYDKENTFVENGHTWIKLPTEEWCKITLTSKEKTMRKHFRRLEKHKIIKSMLASDGTKCFAIDHAQTTKLLNGLIYTA